MPIEDGIQEDRNQIEAQIHRDADVSYINEEEANDLGTPSTSREQLNQDHTNSYTSVQTTQLTNATDDYFKQLRSMGYKVDHISKYRENFVLGKNGYLYFLTDEGDLYRLTYGKKNTPYVLGATSFS